MVTTFQTVGEPWNKELFGLKDKIYYELVHRLLRLGKRYVPNYFVRGMTGFLLENYKNSDGLVGVEVGTQNGFNARVMLSVLPVKCLFCVDPYEDYVEDMGRYQKCNVVGNSVFAGARSYLSGFGDRVVFFRDYSNVAVKNFDDGSLDFVYIDGNHSYDFVLEDIRLFLPKVRAGGVLGGHDFGSRYGGVVQAVFDFVSESGFELFTGRDADWWIIKDGG